MNAIPAQLFESSPDIRYVALYVNGELELQQRPDLHDASGSDTDRFEELLVNPTVLLLTRQRGDIDCGGLEYVVIRYGHFFQVVHPMQGGHVSVAVESTADPIAVVELIRNALGS